MDETRIRVIVKVFEEDSPLEDNEEEEDEQLIERELSLSSLCENDLKDPLHLPSSYEDRGIQDPLATPEDGKSKSPRRKGHQTSKADEKQAFRMTRVNARRMCTSTCSSTTKQNSSFSSININDQVKKEEVDADDDDAGCVEDNKDPDYLPPESASDKGKRRPAEKEENEEFTKKRDFAKERARLSEADKEKIRQRENARRKLRRAMETPAEKEERRRKARVLTQKLHQKLSQTEILDQRKQRERERMRFLRSKMTPEQKKERSRKTMEQRKMRYAQMMPEQKEEESRKNMEWTKPHYTQMTPELKREQSRKNMERRKLRYAQMTPEQKEEQSRKNMERRRQRYAQLTIEERREIRRKDNVNSFFRKEAEKAALTKEEWEQQEFQRKMHNYMQYVARKAKFTPEEWKAKDRRRRKEQYARLTEEKKEARREVTRKYFQNMSEERRMKYQKDNMARMKQYYKKVKETNQAKWKVIQNKLLEYNRKQIEKETPEKRQKRLLRYKVYQAKRKAKLKLEEEGVPPEDIERRLVEIVRQVEEKDRLEREKKPVDPAEYKPREAARKPKKKNLQQFETLPEEEEQTDNSSHFSSTLPQQPNTSLMEESSTQVKDVVVKESVTRDNPVATVSVVDSYSEPCSPAPAFQDDDECFSDSVQSPNTSFPTPVNLDNSKVSNALFLELACAPETASVQDEGHDLEDFNPVKDPVSLQAPEKNISCEIECASSPIIQHESVNTTILSCSIKVEAMGEEVERGVKALEDVPPGINTTKEKDHVVVVCDECGKCLDRGSIKLHKHLLHNPSPQVFKCPKCENSYATAGSLWMHYLENHEETVAKSSNHEANTKKSGGDVEKPKQPRVYGLNGPFICQECGKQYKEKAYMEDHVKRVHLGQRFICEVCGKEEQAAGKLWRHKVTKHPEINAPPPEGMVICEYCAEPVLRNYPQHVKKFHGEKYEEFMQSYSVVEKTANYRTGKRECTVCNKVIGNRWMKTHMINIHGGTKQPVKHSEGLMPKTQETCPHCEKKFKNRCRLKRHIQLVHTFENFDRKVDAMKLIREEVDKDGQRILFCSLCDEELFIRKHMGAHLISSHLEVYEKVKRGESTSSNVDDDEADDVDVPPWKCGECSEKFRTEQLFYSHVHSSHSATKYYCSQLSCHKLFKGFYFLKRHHRKEHPHAKFRNPLLHEGGTYRRPQMICSQCKMKFVRKPQFLEHVKSLHPENYWLCSHCELLCDTKQLLETHLSECRRNPERKRKLKAERNKKRRRKTKKERKHQICEIKQELKSDRDDDNDDDDSDEDDALCEPHAEIGTRSSSRIKEKRTPKKVKLVKEKAKRDKVHSNHKLDMEVRVLVVRLTAEEINFYATKK